MPEHRIFHERNTLTFGGVRDEARRATAVSRDLRKRLQQLFMIVAVELDDSPSKTRPFIAERFQCERLAYRCQTLDLVVIDDNDQVIELMMCREQSRLPGRAFIAFAITQKCE